MTEVNVCMFIYTSGKISSKCMNLNLFHERDEFIIIKSSAVSKIKYCFFYTNGNKFQSI